MSPLINETHDPKLKSWIESANDPNTDFPIQNLPLGVFKSRSSNEPPRVGVAIGNQILNVKACSEAVHFDKLAAEAARACARSSLNSLMALGTEHCSALRERLSRHLRADSKEYKSNKKTLEKCLVPMDSAQLLLPVEIGDYTDFYASIHHATNVGSMFRPDNPLLPNYKYVPIGYHGRSSSIVVSGTSVRRPNGQTKDDDAQEPFFGPCRLLDYELEVGFFVGPGNNIGESIKIQDAESHIFGLCLLDDWSARDIQKWEYQPLGPFLGKSFATTLSSWVVTMEALAPFRTEAFKRADTDPKPLPYLNLAEDQEHGAIDLKLEVFIASEKMRNQKMVPMRLSQGNFKDTYWTIAQMLAHHASNGCNLRPGDLMGSGTVSGATIDSRGCLLELASRGSEPIQLPSGEARRFLQDGDEVIMRAYCQREGFRRIGFGECRGTVLPATNKAS